MTRREGMGGALAGLAATVLLVVLAFVVPPLADWDVAARSTTPDLPPLHGFWDPKVGAATVLTLLLAGLGVSHGPGLARRLPWPRLQLVAYTAGLAWLLSLALVDGPDGLSRTLGNPYEYLETAREVDDVSAMLRGYVDRIPYSHPDNWVTHVAGHPPGALLFFVALVRVGLGGDLAAGVVVTLIAATVPVAVLSTLRSLGAEEVARRVAPLLVLSPAAIFMAVSADAVFAAVGAWGLAALARSARAGGLGAITAWAAAAGLLLGTAVMMSYGLPLLGPLALAVLAAGRSWRPLPVAVLGAVAVVALFAALGFAWWEAYPVLADRYWDGIAAERPAAYWLWANLAALAVCAGPALGLGLGHLLQHRRGFDRTAALLVAGGTVAVLVADLSRMSKAEVERIWLPFVPWLLLATAGLPAPWRRAALAGQVATALVVQHLLYTSW
jgi:hypothetical protein